MKTLSIFLAFFSLVGSGTLWAVPAESKRFTPYFNMNMMQGAFLPTKGDFFAGANVNMSAGLLSKITDSHSIFALYDLGFSGEGFRFPDTKEFGSKELSHNFNGEYRWQIFDWLRARPGANYGFTYSRTAANEVWGEGLYDSKTTGGQLAVDYLFDFFNRNAVFTFLGAYRVVKLPNYSDIIREFQGLSSNSELACCLKDTKAMEGTFSFTWNKAFGKIRYLVNDYEKEKIVESNGKYGTTAQKDTRVILNGGFQGKLWIFETSPNITYTQYRSNQNFLLFKSATDIAPTFASSYYNYSELGFAVPLYMNFTKKTALSGAFDYKRREYTNRRPRDGANNFISGELQKNNMVTLTAGLRRKLNEISAMSITYSSVIATSNNKFEKYLPYNYSGQSIAVGYHLTY